MRLLHTKTRRFRDVSADVPTPKYAILSHTWGVSNSEVSMKELQSLHDADTSSKVKTEIKNRAGYDKIIRVCREAQSDGYDYVWIDTCCVADTYSEESEAVIGMFTWYRQAQVCYAWLRDVKARKPDDEKDCSLVGEKELRKARWFTRGWTVLELVAPQKVEFFDKDWRFLGTRRTLKTLLSGITGIDELVLTGGEKLKDVSVAKRMGWMAGRQTRRAEDVVYSLMGIFNVSMPVLYGEGKKKAFQRLQDEIAKSKDAKDDQTLHAWQPHGAKPISDKHPLKRMEKDENGLSMYASDPADFVFDGSARIVSIAHSPLAVMDIGGSSIKATLKPMPLHEDFFLAVLECRPYDKSNKHLAMVLEKRHGGYVRHGKAPLVSYQPFQKARNPAVLGLGGETIL